MPIRPDIERHLEFLETQRQEEWGKWGARVGLLFNPLLIVCAIMFTEYWPWLVACWFAPTLCFLISAPIKRVNKGLARLSEGLRYFMMVSNGLPPAFLAVILSLVGFLATLACAFEVTNLALLVVWFFGLGFSYSMMYLTQEAFGALLDEIYH